NKVALITLWIEPTAHQILQYEFRNIDFDFLPGRYLARLDDLRARMRMGQAFPDVWLPDTIGMRFAMTLAIGTIDARYDVRYHDYREATCRTRVRGGRGFPGARAPGFGPRHAPSAWHFLRR